MSLRIPVLAGTSAGIVSLLYFLGRVAGVNPWISLIASAVACAALAKWLQPNIDRITLEPPTRWLLAIFGVVTVVSMVTFVSIALKEPHGDWDAWSIWNLHARFLVRGGSQWTALFSKDLAWSHPGYPLLLPALVAQFWGIIGETRFVPIAFAFLFTFGGVSILIGALALLRGWDQALVAGTFLMGGAELVAQGITQYADLPVAFYIAGALALLFFDDVKATILAGAMAGFAAWTKNEGLLFVIALIAARVIARLRFGGAARLGRELAWMAAGMAPALLVLAFFKLHYAPPEGLLWLHKPGELLTHAIDFGRYVTVTEAFIIGAFKLGGFLISGILLLAVYAWMVRFKVEPGQRTALATVVLSVCLMGLGNFAVYVLLPNDVDWQLNTSLPRLLMQLWPAALLGFFAATSKPELAAAAREVKGAKAKDAKRQAGKAAAARKH